MSAIADLRRDVQHAMLRFDGLGELPLIGAADDVGEKAVEYGAWLGDIPVKGRLTTRVVKALADLPLMDLEEGVLGVADNLDDVLDVHQKAESIKRALREHIQTAILLRGKASRLGKQAFRLLSRATEADSARNPLIIDARNESEKIIAHAVLGRVAAFASLGLLQDQDRTPSEEQQASSGIARLMRDDPDGSFRTHAATMQTSARIAKEACANYLAVIWGAS